MPFRRAGLQEGMGLGGASMSRICKGPHADSVVRDHGKLSGPISTAFEDIKYPLIVAGRIGARKAERERRRTMLGDQSERPARRNLYRG